MTQLRLDHLYRETAHWTQSLSWWKTLGLTVVEQWGDEPHRGIRFSGDDLVVVLAEVDEDAPTQAIFIAAGDIDEIAERTGTPVAETHWGTRMVTVTDPDGRTYNFEPGSTDS